MKNSIITALCLFLSLPSLVIAASFDCKNASTKIEKMICTNKVLGAYDIFLARQYTKTRAVLLEYPRERLQKNQRVWLKERGSHCSDVEQCIQFYAQRIAKLEYAYADSGVDLFQVKTPRQATRLTSIDLGTYIAHIAWVHDSTKSVTLIKKEGHKLVQSISLIGDSDNLEYGYGNSLAGGFLDMLDYDKDGHNDLRLEVASGSGGSSYEIWRYNAQTSLFDYYGSDIQGIFKGVAK